MSLCRVLYSILILASDRCGTCICQYEVGISFVPDCEDREIEEMDE